ncbi:MAG: Hint domain-containing protein [Paracoccaceae bacterium]
MATYTIYVLQTNDFTAGPPAESGSGYAVGSPPFSVTVGPGATWIPVTVTDDDSNFGEEIAGGDGGGPGGPTQSLAAGVTLNGVTYNAGDNILTAYDLTNSGTGHQITSFHIGSGMTGWHTGPVVGIVSTHPMPPGTYTFDQERSSYGEDNPYVGKFICFCEGTQILTDTGERSVEELKAGDRVKTRDHGMQVIRWIGSREVVAKDAMAPVLIKKGAFGCVDKRPDPARNLRVSQQHRMVVAGWKAELLFGEKTVLVGAKHLVNDNTIRIVEQDHVTYFHILFDTHEIIYAEGTPSESFHPAEQGMGNLDADVRAEIFAIFPKLRFNLGQYGPTAFPVIKAYEARMLQ